MKRSSQPRATIPVSKSLDQSLSAYALAAGATAMGALVLTPPAEARIVYTPAHIRIIPGTTNLDLNHDGIIDFGLTWFNYVNLAWIQADSIGKNRVWGLWSRNWASHLRTGVNVGANNLMFLQGRGCGSSSSRVCKTLNFLYFSRYTYSLLRSSGPWAKTRKGYLGLKFYIHGKVHFGWARLHRKKLGPDWVLTGYAYETIPNKPIVTGQTQGSNESIEAPTASLTMPSPEPATLGQLALGAPALQQRLKHRPLGTVSEGK